ncbi:MAG: YkgJ family cysteine cluster protein [Planctomycetaceae bacterium]
MAVRLTLPTIQNWSCHNCGGCCRQHLIEVTEEERQRIIAQNWTEADGIPADRPVLVRLSGFGRKQRYRLGHQSDGACVFLDEKGLCRIHAKFGEHAKPLPCRIYPYAFHPGGKQAVVSLRFSCPSVVANLGRPVSEQLDDLKKMAAVVVPESAKNVPPPPVSDHERLDWPDFSRFVTALDQTFAANDVSVTVKLMRALFWINVAGQSKFDVVRGERLGEFLDLMTTAASHEVAENLAPMDEPSRSGKLQFRLLAAQYARKDTFVSLESGLAGRWRLLRSAIRFARGTGNVPPLQEVFSSVPFSALEAPFGGISAEADEILTRYFRVKIQGLHFCGPAYYDVPLVEGFQSLALVFPSVLWLSRWLAASGGRSALTTDDVARALAIADHHHGYSPAFGQGHFRRRVRLLARTRDIGRLCAWYAR